MRRAASYLRTVYRNRRGRDDSPRFLTYTVTFACNARCVMCDSWRKSDKNDLRTDEVERIFAQLPPMDGVRLTGGEPFARRDITEISDLATRYLRPRIQFVSTNGFLTDRIVRFCEQRDRSVPLQLIVSLDGVGETHNRIRGQRFAWVRAIETLRALAPRRSELAMRLSVNQTVIDSEGAAQYRELREVLRPLDVQHHVVIAYAESATYSTKGELNVAPQSADGLETFGDLPERDLTLVLEQVEQDLHELPLAERLTKRHYLRGIRKRQNETGAARRPHCVALNSHLRLFPDGSVPTCQFNSKRVGNLRDQPFDALWSGSARQAQRAWVRACPGCWAECEVVPNAVYSGKLLREAF